MITFNKYNIKQIKLAIETDSISEAVELTIKNNKTKPYKLACLVGQVVGAYTLENSKHTLQMDRLAQYLRQLSFLQK